MYEILTRLLEELRNAWRFRWYALAIAWIVAIGGWLFVYTMPDQYEVSARVHIDTRSAIAPLMRGITVLPDKEDQVRLLVQTVLSSQNLKDIARRTGLDIKASTPKATQSLLDSLASRIDIRNNGYKVNLYQVSFSGSDPKTAQAVVQQVINIMMSMAYKDSADDSRQAMSVLDETADEAKQKLDKLERQMASFRKKHADVMPTGRDDYVAQMQELQGDLDELKYRLTAAKQRTAVMAGAGGSGPQTVPVEQTQAVRSLDSQIRDRRNKLQQMLVRYTGEHPDVIALRKDIDRLEQQRAQKVAELRAHPEQRSVASSGGSAALVQAQGQISGLKAKIERKKNRIATLKSNAGSMTDAQATYQQMARNRDAAQQQYQKLLSRQYTARLSRKVERSGDQLKFNVLDPPEIPTGPTGPNRPLLMLAGLIAGLGCGAVFAFFLSQIRPVFINRRALTDYTGLPVLGAVSLASSMRQSMQRQTALVLFVAGVGTLVLGYLAAVALTPVGMRLMPSLLSSQWL